MEEEFINQKPNTRVDHSPRKINLTDAREKKNTTSKRKNEQFKRTQMKKTHLRLSWLQWRAAASPECLKSPSLPVDRRPLSLQRPTSLCQSFSQILIEVNNPSGSQCSILCYGSISSVETNHPRVVFYSPLSPCVPLAEALTLFNRNNLMFSGIMFLIWFLKKIS